MKSNAKKTRNRGLNQLIALAFIASVGLHPMLIEVSESLLFSPWQEFFLLGMAVGMTFFMFILSKSHFLCSLLQTFGILANTLYFFFSHLDGGIKAMLKAMDYEWCFQVILMWCGGVSVTILIRLFAHKKWNAAHIRRTFGRGFFCSSIVFFLLYLLLLADLFVLQRNRHFGNGTLNLKPLKGAFAVYWPMIKKGKFRDGIFVQFFGNLLIFMPMGFYMALWWRERAHRWILYIFPFFLAGSIEAVQYLFHMGECDIDDAWMNVVGFILGVWLCTILDLIRKKITHGKERTIFKLQL